MNLRGLWRNRRLAFRSDCPRAHDVSAEELELAEAVQRMRVMLAAAVAAGRGLRACAFCAMPTLELDLRLVLSLAENDLEHDVVICEACLRSRAPSLARSLDRHSRS